MNAKKYDSLLALLQDFPDEESCVEHLAHIRWPSGPVCPWCGAHRKFYRIARDHKFKCADCRKQFSVRKGTIFEDSKLPLQTWFAAIWLVTSNRKGIASTQLARELGVNQTTAWFILGRLREVAAALGNIGGPLDGTIETDETYVGGKEKNKHASKKQNAGRGTVGKLTVMGACERGGRIVAGLIAGTSRTEIHQFIADNVNLDATVYSDDHSSYDGLNGYEHKAVCHSQGQYVDGDCHTNSIESFWALLKRGHYGIYHKMTPKHIHRYLAEFGARWNMRGLTGRDRVDVMLEFAPGQRLTYQRLIA